MLVLLGPADASFAQEAPEPAELSLKARAVASLISAEIGLPLDLYFPHVTFASAEKMLALRHIEASTAPAEGAMRVPDVHAFYSDEHNTIYLPADWRAASPADTSLLVHEAVHHLQNLSGATYPCPEARERLAYQMQAAWLRLFGRDLITEFGFDPLTLFVRTRCFH